MATKTINLKDGIPAFDEVLELPGNARQVPRTIDGRTQRFLKLSNHKALAQQAKDAALASQRSASAVSNQAVAGAPFVDTANWCDTIFFLDFKVP